MTDAAVHKSVITCDLEGRIETFNDGAEALFGWRADEVVGRKRVSLFSPGLVVLEHVPRWLETARREGEFATQTVFQRKDGTPIACDFRITPTIRDGEQVGYCGVAESLDGVCPEEVMPQISLSTRILRWLVVTRAPFLTATIVPILFAATWAQAKIAGAFPWGLFGLVMVGGVALHVAANTFNDYFDWQSGTDEGNNDYFLPFSGGSRAVELGLITQRGMFAIGVGASVVAAAIGVALLGTVGPGILWFGGVGLLSAYFYTAPPLRLAARKGLGELLVGMNFGPLLVAGSTYALTGSFAWEDLIAGVPLGLLTTAILWINQFPDAESDARAGKRNLVVVLGKRAARWGYATLLLAAFAIIGVGIGLGHLPLGAGLALLTLPLAVRAVVRTWRHYADRRLIEVSASTIKLHVATGLLLALGTWLSPRLLALLGQ